MRNHVDSTSVRRSLPLIGLVTVLISWLVVQNAALLLLWSWPAIPALLSVARALLKVAGVVAIQLMPAVLLAGGAVMLGVAARRASPPAARGFEEVRHG